MTDHQPVNESDECRLFRQLELSELADDARLSHLNDCASCRSWQEQNRSILNMAGELPQFDVSEQLTQRILQSTSVLPDRTNRQAIWIAVGAAVATAIVFVDASESIGGWWAWLICFASMAGFRYLFSQSKDTMIES
jgi:hypothetical protein